MKEILSFFSTIEHCGYFGPCGEAPRKEGMQQPVFEEKKNDQFTWTMSSFVHRSKSKDLISK
jgi:hypothetical protein